MWRFFRGFSSQRNAATATKKIPAAKLLFGKRTAHCAAYMKMKNRAIGTARRCSLDFGSSSFGCSCLWWFDTSQSFHKKVIGALESKTVPAQTARRRFPMIGADRQNHLPQRTQRAQRMRESDDHLIPVAVESHWQCRPILGTPAQRFRDCISDP